MRVTDTEKFRNELFDNLKVVLFAKCTKIDETFFCRTKANQFSCCALYDCLEVMDYTNADRKFYVILNEECDAIIWKVNKDDDHFTYVCTAPNETHMNKTQFMMSVAVELQRVINQ